MNIYFFHVFFDLGFECVQFGFGFWFGFRRRVPTKNAVWILTRVFFFFFPFPVWVCRWALIAGRIPGRTDNEIKNYWNTHLSKKLINQGIDPRTHKPLNPNSTSAVVKASSSKAKTVMNPNPNPPPPSEKAASGNSMSDNQRQIVAAGNDGGANIHNLGGSGVGVRNSNNIEKDEDLNCGTDDVFSSFLNSLINEDLFHLQQQHHGGLMVPGSTDALISSSSAQSFGFGTSWEAAVMSSASAFSGIDHPKRFSDQTNERV